MFNDSIISIGRNLFLVTIQDDYIYNVVHNIIFT